MKLIIQLIWKSFLVSIIGLALFFNVYIYHIKPLISDMNYIYLLLIVCGIILLIECKIRQISISKVFKSYIALYGLIGTVFAYYFLYGMAIQGHRPIDPFIFILNYIISIAICLAVSIIPAAIFTGIYRLLMLKKDNYTTEST